MANETAIRKFRREILKEVGAALQQNVLQKSPPAERLDYTMETSKVLLQLVSTFVTGALAGASGTEESYEDVWWRRNQELYEALSTQMSVQLAVWEKDEEWEGDE